MVVITILSVPGTAIRNAWPDVISTGTRPLRHTAHRPEGCNLSTPSFSLSFIASPQAQGYRFAAPHFQFHRGSVRAGRAFTDLVDSRPTMVSVPFLSVIDPSFCNTD